MTSPAPAFAPRSVLLADGGEAVLGPLGPEDREAFLAFHRGLSRETRYWRYFSARRQLPEADLHGYLHADPPLRFGLVARIGDAIVAHGSYQRSEPESDAAEAAFEVADAHQGRGLGTLLVEGLAEVARAHGIRHLVAHVMPPNRRMLQVLRDVGYARETAREDGLVRIELDLEERDAHLEAREARERRARAEHDRGGAAAGRADDPPPRRPGGGEGT